MRIGIYGGSFSPVHMGHVNAARVFMEQMWLDVLFIVPAGIPPHKELCDGATADDRLQMCRLAFEGEEGVIVSDIEILRRGKSYTVDTLKYFSTNPEDRLFLLCGTDMMMTLDTWKSPEEIFKLCYPVYIRRESDRTQDAQIIEKLAQYKRDFGKNVVRLVCEPIEISSSEVRDKIRNGQPVDGLIPPRVYEYIKSRGLYSK